MRGKPILIIENDASKKISEALAAACAENQIEGLSFYVAKTTAAADAILANVNDIAAIVSEKDGELDIAILHDSVAINSLKEALAYAESNKPLEVFDAAVFEEINQSKDDGDGDGDGDGDEINYSCRDMPVPKKQQKVKAGALNKYFAPPILIKQKNANGNLVGDLLIQLQKHGLLQKASTSHCEHHMSTQEALIKYKYEIEHITKEIAIIREAIREVNCEIKNCPLKKGKAEGDNASGNGRAIILAIIGLIGTFITVFFGLLGKIFEVVLPYIDKIIK